MTEYFEAEAFMEYWEANKEALSQKPLPEAIREAFEEGYSLGWNAAWLDGY